MFPLSGCCCLPKYRLAPHIRMQAGRVPYQLDLTFPPHRRLRSLVLDMAAILYRSRWAVHTSRHCRGNRVHSRRWVCCLSTDLAIARQICYQIVARQLCYQIFAQPICFRISSWPVGSEACTLAEEAAAVQPTWKRRMQERMPTRPATATRMERRDPGQEALYRPTIYLQRPFSHDRYLCAGVPRDPFIRCASHVSRASSASRHWQLASS